MKKFMLILLTACVYVPLFSQTLYTLDNAINDYCTGLLNYIQTDRGVAVIAFETDRRILMEYFIDTMTDRLWEKGIRPVYERRQLEVLQTEMKYSLDGNVSDETALMIGQRAGVNTVIYGSLRSIGNNNYRVVIRTTNVETAQLIFPKSYDLQMDARLAGLLGIPGISPADSARSNTERPVQNSQPNQNTQPQMNQNTGQSSNVRTSAPPVPKKNIFENWTWTAGASIGTAFSAPGFITTLYATATPFEYSFFELGFDLGLGLGATSSKYKGDENDTVEKYNSFYPFVHYNAGYIDDFLSIYGGLGIGYMLANYTFPTGKIQGKTLAMDFVVGFSIFPFEYFDSLFLQHSGFNTSLVLRTNYHVVNVKFSAGYVFRF